MILIGEPNRVVQKRVKKQGKFRIVPLFRFDNEGRFELDETKYSKTDISKLTNVFKVEKTKVEKFVEKVDLSKFSWSELKHYASEQGINIFGKKKDAIIKELEG